MKIAFLDELGRIFDTRVETILGAMGEGQMNVSGSLARGSAVGAAAAYPVRLAVPADVDPATLRMSMGGAAVAIAPDPGPIGLIARILFYGKAAAHYL